jgi:hypothetical protein
MNTMPAEYEGRDLVAMARKLERFDASHGTEGVQVDARFLEALCCQIERTSAAYDLVTAALEGGAGNPLAEAIRRHDEHTKLLCDAHVAAIERVRAALRQARAMTLRDAAQAAAYAVPDPRGSEMKEGAKAALLAFADQLRALAAEAEKT